MPQLEHRLSGRRVCKLSRRVVEALFDANNESGGFDNVAIKTDLKELCRLMSRKPLEKIDEIIYAICTLCRNHEKVGFNKMVKVGISLTKEWNLC